MQRRCQCRELRPRRIYPRDWTELPVNRPALRLLLAVLLFATTPLHSEDLKVQSTEVHYRYFELPLIIDVSLDKLLALPAGESWTTHELRYVRCQGVGIEDVSFSLDPKKSGESRRLSISTRLYNETRHDKRVTLLVEGLADGEVLSRNALGGKLEQDDHLDLSGPVVLKPFQRWLREPRPVLRLTLTMTDFE